MTDSLSNLSTDVAMQSARQFLREMAQPVSAMKQVALNEGELGRAAFYVARVSQAGIDERALPPMRGPEPPKAPEVVEVG